MDYQELDALLDSLLKSVDLPSTIPYHGDNITYQRKQRVRILFKAVYRLMKAQLFYMDYIKKKIRPLKKTEETYIALKKTRCLKNLRTYLYLSKIGLTDLANHLGGRFRDGLFANFAVATMIYDASFDIPVCRKYLKEFDAFIMNNTPVKASDKCLELFKESVDYLRESLGQEKFDTFMNFVKIEHISQLMSIYQIADEEVTKEDLLKITFSKGGISSLALMYLMAPNMKKEEQKAIYELGAVLQLIDDISDIEEDLKIGIQTLPNQKLLTYQELKALYFGTVNNLTKKCNMNPQKPNGTLDMLCWFDDIILEKRYKTFEQLN